MAPDSRIFVAGHTGFAGSALVRLLRSEGFNNLLLPAHAELDLRDAREVSTFFRSERPEYVFVVAGIVGGIQMHRQCPADMLSGNLAIANSVIAAASAHHSRKLLYFASAACYPAEAEQPIKETALLGGPPDPALAPYALAKIAGVKLCETYARQYGLRAISAMIPGLYGPGDHFEPDRSHAMASLIRRFAEARAAGASDVTVWGSGNQRREFLHVDDMAHAALLLMRNYESAEPINAGAGMDVSIAELARMIRDATGYDGGIRFDPSKPEGANRRLLDSTRINRLGWKPRIPLDSGVRETCRWYAEQIGLRPERPAAPPR